MSAKVTVDGIVSGMLARYSSMTFPLLDRIGAFDPSGNAGFREEVAKRGHAAVRDELAFLVEQGDALLRALDTYTLTPRIAGITIEAARLRGIAAVALALVDGADVVTSDRDDARRSPLRSMAKGLGMPSLSNKEAVALVSQLRAVRARPANVVLFRQPLAKVGNHD